MLWYFFQKIRKLRRLNKENELRRLNKEKWIEKIELRLRLRKRGFIIDYNDLNKKK